MRLPLAVVTRLAVHNFLAQFKMSVPVPDGSVGAAAAGDVGELLGAVLDAQGRRVAQFLEFRRGFEELLVSNDLATYNAVCARVASAFADISGEVNAAGASLRAAGRSDLFESVAALQAQEKEQLRLEATLQVLRKEHAKRAWSWQRRVDARTVAKIHFVDPTKVGGNALHASLFDTNLLHTSIGGNCAEPAAGGYLPWDAEAYDAWMEEEEAKRKL